MNNVRRKKISEAIDLLERARAIIEAAQEEEQEAFDNMPEGLQESDRGQTVEENAERLDEANDNIGDLVDELYDIII